MERFPGYTYEALMDTSPELLRLVKIHALAHPPEQGRDDPLMDGGW